MKIKPRGAHCVECPYKKENAGNLNKEVYEQIVDTGALFPCHMDLKRVVGSDNTGVEQYVEKVDTFMVCQGRYEELQNGNI